MTTPPTHFPRSGSGCYITIWNIANGHSGHPGVCMKIKSASIKKQCPDGELYTFVGGVALVPGFRLFHKPVTITLKEFNEFKKSTVPQGRPKV